MTVVEVISLSFSFASTEQHVGSRRRVVDEIGAPPGLQVASVSSGPGAKLRGPLSLKAVAKNIGTLAHKDPTFKCM